MRWLLKPKSSRLSAAEPAISFKRRTGPILAVIAAATLACLCKAVAQDTKGASLCPLPATSEEILRRRLAITEYVELYKFGPPAAWAMRAGHAALLDHWAKDRKGSANQAKTEFSLTPLTQWLALGRSSSPQEIRDALASTVIAKARPVTGSHKYFQHGVETEPPPIDHVAGAHRAVFSVVVASMFVHGRHTEALELFQLSEYPAERQWHINFLVNVGAVEQAIELYRKPPTRLLSFNSQAIGAIANGLIRDREFERLAAFLDSELLRIREYVQANPSSGKSAWYWQEPLLQQLSRLGRTDWEPPDLLSLSGPASTKVAALASLIAALRSAGREEEAERHRRKVHEFLEREAADLKQRQAMGKPPRIEHMFVAIPSPATFDLFIELERAHAYLIKGDLENAEKIVRPVQVDRHARFSRAAVLENLATYARHQRLWSKAEELLTIVTREPLFPPFSVPRIWLAAASDAQQAGETEVAARWVKNAGTAFCKLDPDRLERHHGLPVGHRGNRKPFVIPFLDSLYVFTAVREHRLPANAR